MPKNPTKRGGPAKTRGATKAADEEEAKRLAKNKAAKIQRIAKNKPVKKGGRKKA